jgi:hypothetical protein
MTDFSNFPARRHHSGLFRHIPVLAAVLLSLSNAAGIQEFQTCIFRVTHRADHPPVFLPSSPIPDSAYKPIDHDSTYMIRFSANYDTVFIDSTLIGVAEQEIADTIRYTVDSGRARFIVIQEETVLKAKLTIYGSGVPVIFSDRGVLEPVVSVQRQTRLLHGLQKAASPLSGNHIFLLNGRAAAAPAANHRKRWQLRNRYLQPGSVSP